MLPEGADAVLMFEYASSVDSTMLEAQRAVAPGENVVGQKRREGDDQARLRRDQGFGYSLREGAGIPRAVERDGVEGGDHARHRPQEPQ